MACNLTWNASKRSLIWINLLGGIAVLGSYVYGLSTNPLMRGDVWGGVPESLKPVYTVSMFLATAGYFAFSYYVLFRLDPRETTVGKYFGYSAFHFLYALILIPSALWMPLTFAMLESPSLALWSMIRLTLATVGIASVGLFAALLSLGPPRFPHSWWAAVVGSAVFSMQTAVLDAIVWPAYFPV